MTPGNPRAFWKEQPRATQWLATDDKGERQGAEEEKEGGEEVEEEEEGGLLQISHRLYVIITLILLSRQLP